MNNRRPVVLYLVLALVLLVFTSFVVEAAARRTHQAVHEPNAPTTSRVSVWSDGGQGDGAATDADISADGRWVVFSSRAMNSTPPNEGLSQIYLHDRLLGTTALISKTPEGLPGRGTSERPSISDDGTVIAFRSGAADLTEGDDNGYFDIIVYDTHTLTLERVSGRGDGSQAQRSSDAPVLSAEGRYVVFETQDALLPIDRNGVRDVYRKDRQSGALDLVSMIYTGGAAGTGVSQEPTVSGDGRYIAFISSANNLVPNDQGEGYQTYWRDMNTGATIRLSVGAGGTDPVGGDCASPSLSADGRIAAFSCAATNLVPDDTNGVADIFVATVIPGAPPALGSVARLETTANGGQPNGESSAPFVAPDGAAFAFTSTATNWVPTDTNGVADVFLWQTNGTEVERSSLASDGGDANTASESTGLANNGAVLFASEASNLVPNDTNAVSDIFVRAESVQARLLYLPLTQK